MVRKLKYHEQKLLKKVDFVTWKASNNIQENTILRRFHIRRREDYSKYASLAAEIRELVDKIAKLDVHDTFKAEATDKLLQKLYGLGLIKTKFNIHDAAKVSASCFCRRRLPVVMVKQKLSENIKNATNLIEQGHVRIGPEIQKDPAFIVTRNLEDFVTWVDVSAIKKKVLEYNDERDDYEF